MSQLDALVDTPSLGHELWLVLYQWEDGDLDRCHARVEPKQGALFSANLVLGVRCEGVRLGVFAINDSRSAEFLSCLVSLATSFIFPQQTKELVLQIHEVEHTIHQHQYQYRQQRGQPSLKLRHGTSIAPDRSSQR